MKPTPRFLGSEFNPFLFALIGAEQSGRPLSVVSALARLDLDAWAEAANLSRLPRDIAAHKLSVLLDKFTDVPRIVQDSGAIATRLIALLPNRAPAHAGALTRHPRLTARTTAAAAAILIAVALLIALQHFQHAPPSAAFHTPASLTR